MQENFINNIIFETQNENLTVDLLK